MGKQVWKYDQPFALEKGGTIDQLTLAYHTYGEINEDQSNVVWVFHALTANSDVLDWWKGLFGQGHLFDPAEYFIICVNTIGSPYGSSVPHDLNFPEFTVRDVAESQILLANHLGVERIHLAIGGSFGGSQALEFTYSFSGSIEQLVLVACGAKESAWGIAIHSAQRLALQSDQTFGTLEGGTNGLKAARAIGMLHYRTDEAFNKTQSDHDDRISEFSADKYLQYQGDKLVKRFNALSYYYLHKCLDAHNFGRGRWSVSNALQEIDVPTLVVGISTDRLVPTTMQKELAEHLPNGIYKEIDSEYGHDGFLIETEQLTHLIQSFLTQNN